MGFSSRMRIAAVVCNFVVLGVALGIRAVTDGPVAQFSGTALYTSIVYGTVVFLAPRVRPWVAAAVAVGFSYAVEFSQLTGVPAALSARSVAARFVLGMQFDVVDLCWYPVGVLPMLALHRAVARRGSMDMS